MNGGPLDLARVAVMVCAPSDLAPTVQAVVRQAGGRSIVVTSDPEEIARLGRLSYPDLVLIDETLGEQAIAGLIAAVAALKPDQPKPPIILMASEPTRPLLEQALVGGIESVIAKPFSARTLCAHVARARSMAKTKPVEPPDQFILD